MPTMGNEITRSFEPTILIVSPHGADVQVVTTVAYLTLISTREKKLFHYCEKLL